MQRARGSSGLRLFLLFLAAAVPGASHAATITLDPATTYQTISGWEAVAWASNDSPAFVNFIDEVVDRAVNEVGIDRVRLEIRSGVENSVGCGLCQSRCHSVNVTERGMLAESAIIVRALCYSAK